MKSLKYLCFLLFTCSCLTPESSKVKEDCKLNFAKGFDISYYSDYQVIKILNPWQKSRGETFSYLLTNKPEAIPDSLLKNNIIKTPVKSVIVFSTTHVGFVAALGKSSTITGVSGKDFISDSTVIKSLENKRCFDIGFAPNIDFERILAIHPDVVFLYGLDPSVSGLIKRLDEAGIKSVLVSEFLEEHPLGKAEWIKFFSAFFDCKNTGDSIYSLIEHNYLALKDSVVNISEKPKVLVGLPWKDTWYMAGGQSFTARLIEDAGGEYLWKVNLSNDYIPLDLESAFQKAINADFWINTGSAESKNAILSADPRFQYIRAFQKGEIYNNNLKINTFGGNDFWESGAVRPDKILSDLITIFHADKFKKYEFYYYRKLK